MSDSYDDEYVLSIKSWTEGGFDFTAYKVVDPSTPNDFPGEFDEFEIESFNSGKWIFAQVTVVCSLLGVRLGYSFCDLIPEGIAGDGEIEDAFEIIKEFDMEQEALIEAREVIEQLSLEEAI